MSLRDLFSRNTTSHRRRKNAKALSALAAQAEFLEDRVLLSVESPFLTDHGVAFRNANVLGRTSVTFFSVDNPLYSNNAGGSGLDVDLDGAALDGNLVTQLRNITYSNLVFTNNGNTGSSIDLRNMTLDTLVIDGSQFIGNGRAGLIINLTNMQIGTILIANSAFLTNVNDGLCIMGSNSSVDNIQIISNNLSGSGVNDGVFIQFENSRLGAVNLSNNQANGNGSHGIRFDLDNTNVANLSLNQNIADNNALHAAFLDIQDSDVRGSVNGNSFTNSQLGDGLKIQTRRSILPTGMVAEGLRNLDLDSIRGNTLSANNGIGLNIDLGQNTTFASAITANTIANNTRTGVMLQARDTQNAFDVRIGGETIDAQNNNLDANTIDGNQGAGIVINLDDTSNVVGNTSGRFRILNNIISNTADDNLLGTEFAGEGIFVRARGSAALVNGAARILNSRIDGNTITGNASHGMFFNISEDSEVVDLLIGDVFVPNDPREGLEGNGFFFQNQFFRNSGNIVTNNGGDGLNFLRRDAAVVRDIRIIDNLFDGNNNGINYVVRNDDNVVNSLIVQHNDATNNRVNGISFSTQIDAILNATVDNNLIAGNLADGVTVIGVESDPSDAETFGGTFTRNTIQANLGKGISLDAILGDVAPLSIGLMGFDAQGRSLGNLIDSNGDDGIEINSFGFVDIVNNVITSNGQNNTARDVHGDGKGIDINLNDFATGINAIGSLTTEIMSNVIQGNLGDGIEAIARATVFVPVSLQMTAFRNIIDLNLGRGVDILNAGDAETYAIFGDGVQGAGSNQNIIRSNGLEGFYAVNTSSINQRQDVDATVAMIADTNLANAAERSRAPNLTLDISGNQIQQNGLPTNPGQLNGSGLVIRVGTTGSNIGSEFLASDIPDYEGVNLSDTFFPFNSVGTSNSATTGNGRVNARVHNNTFGGNFGVDVITESFTSTADPATTSGTWNGTTYDINNNGYTSDPLARLNLQFTMNTGEAVDLVRLGAFYNNAEGTFKSRTSGRTAPDPNGPFGGSASRFRNAQRLPGRGDGYTSPLFGPGGLFTGTPISGSVANITPGSGNVPLIVTTVGPHGLVSGQTVLIDTGFFFGSSGFSLNNLFEITVIDATTFALNDTEGETNIEEFLFSFDTTFTLVNNVSMFGDLQLMLYPGVGPSTFRIIEAGNSFPQGSDFEDAVSYFGGGVGHEPYTFDREEEGAFNFRTLSVSDATITEGGMARFDVTLSEALDVDVQVFYHTAFTGSADSDVDFTAVDLFELPPVIIPAGQTTASIFIQTNDDITFEGPETFRLLIDGVFAEFIDPLNPFNTFFEEAAVPVNPVALGTILDNDAAPTLSISDAGGFEQGLGGLGTMTFTVTLSGPSATPVFVDFSTADFTANVDVDYRAKEGTLTFSPGETVKTITIEILPDSVSDTPVIDQDLETLFVNLTSPQGALVTDAQGVGTIFDARFITITPAFADGDGTAGETSIARFVVSLTDSNGNPSQVPIGQEIRINYSTQDGTAVSTGINPDYVPVTGGLLVLGEGQSSGIIAITVNQDRIFEGDERFQLTVTSTQATVPVSTTTGNILESYDVVASRNVSGVAEVRVVDLRTNTPRFSINPYPGFKGEVRVATADFNNDGIADIVTAPGRNGGPHIKVLNGADGSLMFEFMAYAPNFFGGVFVATGDINGDLVDDIITGPDTGGGAHIRVFDALTGFVLENFIAGTTTNPSFFGGVRVASGNVDGLGPDEIILGYGPGGPPLVDVYTTDGNPATEPVLFRTFNAYGADFRGGIYVSAADFNGDTFADIITGAGAGGGPHVRVFSGSDLSILENFFAYAENFFGGVRVASGDVADDPNDSTRNRVSEILTAPGFGGGPHVRAFNVDADPGTIPPSVLDQFAFPSGLISGVFIAGRNRNQVGEGSPLLLDGSVSSTGAASELTQAELASTVDAAFNRLSAAGVDSSALDQLRGIQFVLADLEGALLGWQTPGRILIDRTAAGRGYFVDLTPDRDEEFSNQFGRLLATDEAALGRVDLLTVILHELGHALGEEHVMGISGSSHLLAPTLLPGERRLPEHDHVFATGDIFESLLDLN